MSARSSAVFPEPFGPMIASADPLGTLKLRPLKTVVRPNRMARSLTSRTLGAASVPATTEAYAGQPQSASASGPNS